MRQFEYKYKIDKEHGVVVAISTFAHKKVAGVAKCAPGDTFDEEKGKALAAARCNLKIANKRRKWAAQCLAESIEIAAFWAKRESDMQKYFLDTSASYDKAALDLVTLEKTL